MGTIRDEIRRRSRATGWVAAMIGATFTIASGFFALGTARRNPHSTVPSHLLLYVMLAAMMLFVTALTLLKRAASAAPKCPKCGTDLGFLAYLMSDTSRRKKINFCPYCAVSLDDPMPDAPTPAEKVTTPDKLVWK